MLFSQILETARCGIGIASVEEIDSLNILEATKLAMIRAFNAMPQPAEIALIDGNKAPLLPCECITVIGGDAKSLSIAAASILAKVTRDRIMAKLALEYPHYGWEKNAGYGTSAHQIGLAKFGVTPHHRRSYAPIKRLLTK
jgi:ribonuclease HII